MIGWDTETALIQPGLLAPPLACITFAIDNPDRPELIHWRDPACKRTAAWILGQPNVGANVAYDLAVLGAQWPDLMPLIFETLAAGNVHDIQIRQKLLDIGDGCYRFKETEEEVELVGADGEKSYVVEKSVKMVGYSLSDLYKRYFNISLDKDEWRLKYGQLRELPLESWPQGARTYPLLDATATLKVFWAQNDQEHAGTRAKPEVYLHDEPAQVRAAFALHLVSAWGIRTDPRAVQAFVAKIDREQAERRAILQQAGLVAEDEARAQKKAREYMVSLMGDNCTLSPKGLEEYRAWWAQAKKLKTLTESSKQKEKRRLIESGKVSLKADVCRGTGDALLIEYAKYGQHQTLRTKVQRLANGTFPIQTSFETLLETGRSSSFANGLIPNSVAIQNLPRAEGMRECFVPRVGKLFCSCDYGMAELVSLAQVCFAGFKQSRLREALNAGKDPHLMLAANMSKQTYEYVVEHKKDKEVKHLRQTAKPASFGYPGGLGVEKFVDYARSGYGVVLSPEEARALKEDWLRTWPEMQLYFNYIGKLCEQDVDGLADIIQYKSRRVRGRIGYTVACNTLFQGLTADAAKAALFEVMWCCYAKPESVLFGSRVVNFIHDEILLECDESNAHAISFELKRIMEEVYQAYTPDVLIKAEPALMRRWRKSADPVFKDGQLIPWEDR